MDGILVVNKPMDFTSFDAVAIVRRASGASKIGHTGTLDPNATGVLVMCFGKATRLIEYMDRAPKTYKACGQLGLRTATQDIWGDITQDIRETAVFPSRERFEEALSAFKGEIEQIPPAYSAKRVNGRKLYSYAHEGVTVDVKPKKVNIYDISDIEYSQESGIFSFTVRCSRGTFIRTIISELGDSLGPGAAMTSLVRTEACGFDISQAADLEELRGMPAEKIESLMHPIEEAVTGFPRIDLNERGTAMFLNGNRIKCYDTPSEEGVMYALFGGDRFLGLAVRREDRFVPEKVFC